MTDLNQELQQLVSEKLSQKNLPINKNDIVWKYRLEPEQVEAVFKVIKNPQLTHEEFYSVLRTQFSPVDVYMHLLGILEDSEKALDIMKKLLVATEEITYINLLAEPHIALRIDQFTTFVESHTKPLPDASTLREEFIQNFPDVTYVRSLFLTSEEAEAILKNGFENKLIDQWGDATDRIASGQDRVSGEIIAGGLDADVFTQISMGYTNRSIFHSVARNPDFSEAITANLVHQEEGSRVGKQIYTFEIQENSFYALPIDLQRLKRTVKPGTHWEVKTGLFKRTNIPMEPYPEDLLSFAIPPKKVRLLRKVPLQTAPTYRFVGGFEQEGFGKKK